MQHPTQAVQSQTVVRTESADVEARLAELSIPRGAIDEVLRASIAGRNSATPHHARNYGGTRAYHEAVCTARDELVWHGFRPHHEGGLEMCVHDELGIAIMVVAGDSDTGRPDGEPSTARERGPSGVDVIDKNRQVSMFMSYPGFDVRTRPTAEPSRSRRRTWMLLHRQTKTHMWSELSLAVSVDKDGRPDGWEERIIFPPLVLGAPEPTGTAPIEPIEPTPEIEIDIVAR